ncbi:MAG TPA: hypothetical protein IAD04_05535 [Candidatus Caccosoma faecigallinarum]|uniref:Uncharacterized protein n=1 Tax=Candidatus Caccosoma faecigallinarum TaxID=2840720 RepID=A0A9D1KB11_9FIRM|nr:hypothetical protein [Candidatus Caccosoma faecigallinarum]
MKKNVEITLSKELIIPRDVFGMEELLKLQDKAIAIYKTSADKDQRNRCMRFVLSMNDLRQIEENKKLEEKEKENGI